MSENQSQFGVASSENILRARCRALGVSVWRYDADRVLRSSPSASAPVESLCSSSPIKHALGRLIASHDGQQEPIIEELIPGMWIVVIAGYVRRRLENLWAFTFFGSECFAGEPFETLCAESGLDAGVIANELRRSATFTAESVRSTAEMLGWAIQDLRSIDQKSQLVSEFSQQLSDTFEEISLFYTLGQSMNELAHPEKFVDVACAELQESLSYGWVAAAFIRDSFIVRGMAGKTCIAGDMPCSQHDFERHVNLMLPDLTMTSPSVLKPEEAGVFGTDGMQVLVRPVVYDKTVVGVLLAGGKCGKDTLVSTIDTKVFDAAAGHLSVLIDNSILFEDQQLMFMGTLEALSASIDAKDPYTCGHSERVALISRQLAIAIGMSEAEAERVHIGGLVHDVGKIGVPESTLCKAGRLTDDEFLQIKLHPQIGHDILKDIPQFADVLPGVLYHHERYDGRGYPTGLSGESIPLIARIIGLADSFDAMSSTRTYRAALDREKVIQEIADCAGTQFDPALAEVFPSLDLAVYDELVAKHHEKSMRGGLRTSRGRNAA